MWGLRRRASVPLDPSNWKSGSAGDFLFHDPTCRGRFQSGPFGLRSALWRFLPSSSTSAGPGSSPVTRLSCGFCSLPLVSYPPCWRLCIAYTALPLQSFEFRMFTGRMRAWLADLRDVLCAAMNPLRSSSIEWVEKNLRLVPGSSFRAFQSFSKKSTNAVGLISLPCTCTACPAWSASDSNPREELSVIQRTSTLAPSANSVNLSPGRSKSRNGSNTEPFAGGVCPDGVP